MRSLAGVGVALALTLTSLTAGGAQAHAPGGFQDGSPVPAVLGGQGVTAIVGAPGRPGGTLLYIADKAGIERRDMSTSEQVGVAVSSETGFRGLALTSDGSLLYATQPGVSRVAVFATATNRVLRRMGLFGTAMSPTAIAVSPDGTRLYTASSTYSSISVLNAATGSVERTVPAPAAMTPASAISLTPDGRRLFVADSTQGMVWSIDTTSFATAVTATGLGGPLKGFAISDDGLTGYAAVGGDAPSLKTIDIAKGVAIDSAALGETPSTTALLWQNQVFVAQPSHQAIDVYYAPFAPQPEIADDGMVAHGIVGRTDEVRVKPTLPPGITVTYQWFADGKSVPGATSRVIRLAQAQLGAQMRVVITTHGVGVATNFTFADFENPVLAPMLPRKPIISGRAAVGRTVKAKVGSWGPHTKVRFAYQWYAGKKAVRGATRAKLRIGKATVGKRLRLRVIGQEYLTRQSALSRFTKKVKH